MLQEDCADGNNQRLLFFDIYFLCLNAQFTSSLTCIQICYFFYKNIAFGLTLFYFEAFTGFSGQSVYDDWYMLLFNVILTSLPVISLGVFEQDVSSEVCLQVIRPHRLSLIWYVIHFHPPLSLFSHFSIPVFSFLHCISKALETCSLTGIGYLGGWGTVYTPPSSSSFSTSSSSTTRPSALVARQLTWLLWEPQCSPVSYAPSTVRSPSQ